MQNSTATHTQIHTHKNKQTGLTTNVLLNAFSFWMHLIQTVVVEFVVYLYIFFYIFYGRMWSTGYSNGLGYHHMHKLDSPALNCRRWLTVRNYPHICLNLCVLCIQDYLNIVVRTCTWLSSFECNDQQIYLNVLTTCQLPVHKWM